MISESFGVFSAELGQREFLQNLLGA